MKSARSIFRAVLAVSIIGSPALIYAADPTVLPTVQPVQINDMGGGSLTQAIQQAQEPSAAVQAYQGAAAAAPGDISVERAYVQRMVDFGLPEMADTQAQDLVRRNPQDGLGLAVAAYMNAKRDQNEQALRNIVQAVRYQPDNVFVLRTAAQVLAWYDTRADQSTIPEDVKSSAGTLRVQLASNPTFSDAYSDAADAFKQMGSAPSSDESSTPANPQQPAGTNVSTYRYSNRYSYYNNPDDNSGVREVTTQPSTATTATAEAPADNQTAYVAPPPAYYPSAPDTYNTYNTYYTSPNPYVSYYPDYADWWPGSYWGAGAWWWPTFGSVVIVNRDCFRDHRFFHHGGFHNDAFFHNHGRNFAFVGNRNFGRNTFAVSNNSRFPINRNAGVINPRNHVTPPAFGRSIQNASPSFARNRVVTPNQRFVNAGVPTRQFNPSYGGYRTFSAPSGGRFVSPAPSGRFGGPRVMSAPSGPRFSAPAPTGPRFGGARFGGNAPGFGGGGAHFGGFGGGGGHISGGGGGGGGRGGR